MYLFIGLFISLLLDILANNFFITMTSYRTDKIAFRPKFATPELLFDCRTSFKNLSRCQTFDHLDHFCWTIAGAGLHKKMHMILVRTNLYKDDLVAFGDVQTDLFEYRVDLLVKDNASLFGRAHDMVNQDGDVVAFMSIFAHESDNNISEESEASFGESDPQRLTLIPRPSSTLLRPA